jgi:hypothetical protein
MEAQPVKIARTTRDTGFRRESNPFASVAQERVTMAASFDVVEPRGV